MNLYYTLIFLFLLCNLNGQALKRATTKACSTAVDSTDNMTCLKENLSDQLKEELINSGKFIEGPSTLKFNLSFIVTQSGLLKFTNSEGLEPSGLLRSAFENIAFRTLFIPATINAIVVEDEFHLHIEINNLVSTTGSGDYTPNNVAEKRINSLNQRVFKTCAMMPQFPGCEFMDDNDKEKNDCVREKINDYLSDKIGYALDDNGKAINEMAVIQFIVGDDGILSNYDAVRPLKNARETNNAIYKAINEMPNWKPGASRKGNVHVLITLPLRFQEGEIQ